MEDFSAAARAVVRRDADSGYRLTCWSSIFGGMHPATFGSGRKDVVVLFVSNKRTHPFESHLMPPDVSAYT